MGLQLTLVLALLFALAVAAFAVQNADPIVVRFLQWEARTSLVVVILGAAVLGALSAGLAGAFRQLRTGLRVRNLQHQTQRLEEEAAALRTDRDDLRQEVQRLRQQLDRLRRSSPPASSSPTSSISDAGRSSGSPSGPGADSIPL